MGVLCDYYDSRDSEVLQVFSDNTGTRSLQVTVGNKKPARKCRGFSSLHMAEGGGFEPTEGCPSPVFKTGTFGQLSHPSAEMRRIHDVAASFPLFSELNSENLFLLSGKVYFHDLLLYSYNKINPGVTGDKGGICQFSIGVRFF